MPRREAATTGVFVSILLGLTVNACSCLTVLLYLHTQYYCSYCVSFSYLLLLCMFSTSRYVRVALEVRLNGTEPSSSTWTSLNVSTNAHLLPFLLHCFTMTFVVTELQFHQICSKFDFAARQSKGY